MSQTGSPHGRVAHVGHMTLFHAEALSTGDQESINDSPSALLGFGVILPVARFVAFYPQP